MSLDPDINLEISEIFSTRKRSSTVIMPKFDGDAVDDIDLLYEICDLGGAD